jgi:sodium/bile acid cotransporter 7
MLKRLSAILVDSFLLALAATVILAALVPAHGQAAHTVSAAAKTEAGAASAPSAV